MAISIREHCIPCYNEIAAFQQVAPIPEHLDGMEQKTAGGIVKKAFAIIKSKYFDNLPETAVIQSGAMDAFKWNKARAAAEIEQIYKECQPYI